MRHPPLSVVIPAYKAPFLGAALASLEAQTDSEFEVVVADDASPDDIKSICDAFHGRLALRYLRFDRNLGQACLVDHWTRAIDAAAHDWIWLMGDDDELERRCIETLRGALSAHPDWPGLWHVDVVQIDANGSEMNQPRAFAPLLSAADFVRQRMQARLGSFACEYVFRRSMLRERGGFLRFPLAWCADDATWVRLAGRAGMRTVAGPESRARWRLSGTNISSAGADSHDAKLEARLQYLEWLATPEAQAALNLTPAERRGLGPLCCAWFLHSLHATRTRLAAGSWPRTLQRLSAATGGPLPHVAWQLWRAQRWTAASLRQEAK